MIHFFLQGGPTNIPTIAITMFIGDGKAKAFFKKLISPPPGARKYFR